jgi:hypothetical protein
MVSPIIQNLKTECRLRHKEIRSSFTLHFQSFKGFNLSKADIRVTLLSGYKDKSVSAAEPHRLLKNITISAF